MISTTQKTDIFLFMNDSQGLAPLISADEAFWLLRLMSKCTHHFPEIPLSFPPFTRLHPTTLFFPNVLVVYLCGLNRHGFNYYHDNEERCLR